MLQPHSGALCCRSVTPGDNQLNPLLPVQTYFYFWCCLSARVYDCFCLGKCSICHDYSACLCCLMSTNSLQTTMGLINERRYGNRDLDTSQKPEPKALRLFLAAADVHKGLQMVSRTVGVQGKEIF